MDDNNNQTKYWNNSTRIILVFLIFSAIGIIGSNLVRMTYGYNNVFLLVAFVVVWAISFIVLTVLFWRLFSKSGILPALSILTMVSPIISILVYVFFGKYPTAEDVVHDSQEC